MNFFLAFNKARDQVWQKKHRRTGHGNDADDTALQVRNAFHRLFDRFKPIENFVAFVKKKMGLGVRMNARAVPDEQLDAYFYVAGTPVAAMIQLDNTKGMELYSFSDEEIVASNKAVPFYVRSIIPAGTYAGIQYDVNTLAVNGILVTSSDQDEELIYAITKALWGDQARRLLDTGHAKGKMVTLETALDGILSLDVPIHPGAERFYKEIGMLQ